MKQGSLSTFAIVLRKKRNERGWSQAELGLQFMHAVPTDTVSRWERDKAKPNSHNVEELCKLFKMTAAEFGLIPNDNDKRVMWKVPTPNSRFIGREKYIDEIHRGFNSSKPHLLYNIQCLHSLSGMGKTQICMQYVHSHGHQYQTVLWISAATEENVRLSLVELATRLQLSEKDTHDQHVTITAVKKWLFSQSSWLLVLDDVVNAQQVSGFLTDTKKGNGHILFTTRNLTTPLKDIAQHCILVDKMNENETRELLLTRKQPSEEGEQKAVEEITHILDGVPLVIGQVSVYIDQTQCGFSTFLELWQTQHKELLGEIPADDSKTGVMAWLSPFQKIADADPMAANLLHLCCFLNSDKILEEIIIEAIFPCKDRKSESEVNANKQRF
ncbi:MAG: NB-ARC domain-containing protein, partial [Rhabdochlamydiaceae bacterium]